MEGSKNDAIIVKLFSILGSILLLFMAVFHGMGFSYVSEAISTSNAEKFLKQIVPTLFAHPSIHLIGLASFGVLTIFLKQDRHKVQLCIALLIIIDALLAFNLDAIIPSVLLMSAALCFFLGSWKSRIHK